jgi:hypothetical protein
MTQFSPPKGIVTRFCKDTGYVQNTAFSILLFQRSGNDAKERGVYYMQASCKNQLLAKAKRCSTGKLPVFVKHFQ